MANFDLTFYGTEKSRTDEHKTKCYVNSNYEIYMEICVDGYPDSFICFDKSTAIKFAKTLRTEINKIQD
jgi:hypothetical protein